MPPLGLSQFRTLLDWGAGPCQFRHMVEMFAGADEDQDVARLQDFVTAGVEDHVAGALFDGHHDDAVLLPQTAVLDRPADQLAVGGNACLFDL